jgi:hypothetical protein
MAVPQMSKKLNQWFRDGIRDVQSGESRAIACLLRLDWKKRVGKTVPLVEQNPTIRQPSKRGEYSPILPI